MPIIQSLLDTDLYKFTMLQVVLHRFPQAHGVYEFRCRNAQTVYPLADIIPELEQELNALCELRLNQDELGYLRGLRFIKFGATNKGGSTSALKAPLSKPCFLRFTFWRL